ncbi:hypothetical protein ELY21_12990 [Legionella sp. km535]|uniref:hypothetical protein n=1 Tax=Legionella sp. km535 TaxID=2498107 RepID=UPI000F8C6715|nr:hypothetical protein [Legionella sp. km535]RUR16403.1 hypothetical protein ELY21_12990 [Legionella sp. km535]
MFERIDGKGKVVNGVSFVVLKDTLDSRDESFIDVANIKKSDYILSILSTQPERFDFHEVLTVNLDSEKAPKGMDAISERHFTYRYSAEFRLSLQALKELTDDRTTEYKGKHLNNPKKVEKILNTLRNSVVGVHIDILNEETKEWDRFKTLPLSLVTAVHSQGCCLIL